MKINLAVAEPPRFTMLPAERVREGYSGGLFIAPTIDYMQRACDEARAGRPAAHPFLNVHLQSAVDDTVAPAGRHTLSIFTQYFPYRLAEGTWDERRDAIADQVLAELGRYAPNVPGSVIARQVLAPPDLEARFGLTGGHIFHGELVPEQAFDLRPVPGLDLVRGPDPGALPLRLRRLARRLRHGRARPQRRPGGHRAAPGRPDDLTRRGRRLLLAGPPRR